MIGGAVADRVRHQAEAGVDLVSDGEMSKIGYATYIRHRLSGFELGDVPRATPADLDAYPRSATRLADAGATREVQAADLPRPDRVRAPRAASSATSRGWRAAVEGRRVAGGFMNAPSPGIIALFQPNEYYADARRVPRRARRGDEDRVRGDRRRRVPAADRLARTSRWAATSCTSDRSRRGVRRSPRRGTSRRSTARCATSRPTTCACTCAGATTRARTTSTSPSRRSSTSCCEAKPATILFEAANPRHEHEWAAWREADDPRRQDPRPGRDRLDHQLHRAPGAGRAADRRRSPTSSGPSA